MRTERSLIFVFLLIAFAMLPACQKKVRSAAPPFPPAPEPEIVSPPKPVEESVVPIPLPPPVATPTAPSRPRLLIEEADILFEQGQYVEAARRYQIMMEDESSPQPERTKFRLGMIYLLPQTGLHDLRKATGILSEVARDYANTPWGLLARHVLSLDREVQALRSERKVKDDRIKLLTTEIEKLKRIDLERTRKPDR